ncbi:MAG: efflux transporter outer membrane subunit [Chlorobiaceae bacterium]|nr:efflux transporter outer membrane subunit [Chlorobiaceae bacterium]NTV60348.1 efflux transporter outer membrane subunit [Chlorobiaceae bacterium]
MTGKSLLSVFLVSLALASCSMAPDYVRPPAPVAQQWPAVSAAGVQPSAESAGQLPATAVGWRSMFRSPKLQLLIESALENNRDLRIATLNIEAARNTYRIQRSELIPSISASGSFTRQRLSESTSGTGQPETSSAFSAGLGATAYELDLFGRIRSESSGGFNRYLATEEGRRAAQITLVAEVANAYLAYLADTELLQLTEQTLRTRQDSSDLIKRSFELGARSRLDMVQAASLVESARASLARYQRQAGLDRNALTLLVGKEIEPELLKPESLSSVSVMETLPAGVPSSVLLDRPDVRQAEFLLKAENANIGAARAAFFPIISLTGSAGFASSSLSGLFSSGPNGIWSFIPQITLPIFQGERLMANLRLAKTKRDIAVAQYEKAVQTAFREVSDALVARATYTGQLKAQQELKRATETACAITKARYDHGIDSYFVLLDAQRSLYEAQQNEILVRQENLVNLIDLYKVLGGGWQ